MNAFDVIDHNGNQWPAIKKFLDARLLELREKNDDPQLSDAGTQFVRGAISEIKNLLAEPAGKQVVQSYYDNTQERPR